jgi:PadR family transcriptional regulator PadR
MTSAASLGQFEQLVLTSILSLGDTAYGVTIHARVEELMRPRTVALGAVYATLDRLEAKGLLGSGRARQEGSRRVFLVTRRGAAALAESRAMRDRLWHGVSLARLLAE